MVGTQQGDECCVRWWVHSREMKVVLGIVIVSFLSHIYYAHILGICSCHGVAYFPFVLLHICVCTQQSGVSNCSTCVCTQQ